MLKTSEAGGTWPEASRVASHNADTIVARDNWSRLPAEAPYEVIAAPPEDPAWVRLEDVAGDNTSGEGTTSLSWNLQ